MKKAARTKYIVKLLIVYSLYAVGLLQLWQRIVLRRRAVVLMYHRVLTEDEMAVTASHPAIVVKRETFAAQMEVISKRFKVLTIDQFVDHMEQNIPFENSSCLVTFDDGWRDNYAHASPILKQYGIPAVVFLPVDFIGGTRLFWQEQLTYLIVQAIWQVRHDPSRRNQFAELLAPLKLESILDCPHDDPRLMVMHAVRKNKTFPPSMVNETVAKLESELNENSEKHQEAEGFLNWEQVALMLRQGIAFGGHGAEHRILTSVPLSEAEQEISVAKETLDNRLRVRVPTFSYPNGNWSSEVARLVEKAGFRAAFTTDSGHVKCGDDRFTVRRINIFEEDTKSVPLFLARVVGLF